MIAESGLTINASEAKSIHDLVEWRNRIQFDADKFGIRLATERCWEKLKPANLIINQLIAGQVDFSESLAESIQESFDRAIEAVKTMREENGEK